MPCLIFQPQVDILTAADNMLCHALLCRAVWSGGTSPMDQNSQNYSAIKTPVPPGAKLPQIVVQMPVYKESLEEVRVMGALRHSRCLFTSCLASAAQNCLKRTLKSLVLHVT
jgi:hypothetical protein